MHDTVHVHVNLISPVPIGQFGGSGDEAKAIHLIHTLATFLMYHVHVHVLSG